MSEKEQELKPCPFCGGEARYVIVDGWHRFECVMCGLFTGRYNDKTTVTEYWNRRNSNE